VTVRSSTAKTLEQPPGLRARKKTATRQALSWAAMRLAVERGLDSVLIEDIAAAVGVSPRTFNNYFSSKYEAICALGLDRARRAGAALRERPASEPLWEAITEAVVGQYAGPLADAPNKEWLAGVRLVTSAPALRGEYLKSYAAMQQALAEAIAERSAANIERDMLPRIMAGAVSAAAEVAIDRWIHADPPTSLERLIRLALRQLAGAFTTTDRPTRRTHDTQDQLARGKGGAASPRGARLRTGARDDRRRKRRRRAL
jgi:AcrR family transcriptional regulator